MQWYHKLSAKQAKNFPDVIEKTEEEVDQIIALIKNCSFQDETKTFIIKCIEFAMWLPIFVSNTKISMYRFAVMIFGPGYRNKKEKKSKANNKSSDLNHDPDQTNNQSVVPQPSSSDITPVEAPAETNIIPANSFTVSDKKPGHGRMPYTIYKERIEITLKLALKTGDPCPHACGGKLGKYDAGNIIRIKGGPIANVYHYTVEKLRCRLCLAVISADIPPIVANADKYDAYFKTEMVLLKYYLGMPFYRQENFQRMLDFPLPDATQWELCEEVAGCGIPIFNVLKELGGNGELIHNDDTWIRILSVIKKVKDGTAGKRSGMYTTGILSYNNGHKIALFLNGRKHSGENMADILELRDPKAEPVIQMCDAINANNAKVPKDLQTILCNCLSHGVRKFTELVDFFPEECVLILEKLSKIYDHDDKTKLMDKHKRLEYHQNHSKLIMNELNSYMKNLLDDHKVEPNGELGKALKYMLRHWHKLTKFLTIAGAPIDNNIIERALKISIRNRKASYFYQTEYSAYIGGVLTSLIYTCHLAEKNPQHYLTAIQTYKSEAESTPTLFLPWNYQETINRLEDAANQEACLLQIDPLAAA